MSAAYRRGKVFWTRLHRENGQNEPRSTRTTDKALARSIEAMVKQLRARRQWPLLEALWTRSISIGRMHDYWSADRLDDLTAELHDVNLTQYLDGWHAALIARFGHAPTDMRNRSGWTPGRYLLHVRRLMPEGEPYPRSGFTADAINAWVASLATAPATKARHLAALASFAGYLVQRGVLEHSPVPSAQHPRQRDLTRRTRHLTLAESTRLIESFGPGDPMRAVETLAHLGVEWGAIAALRASDVDLAARRLHAHGTKTASRDRWCVIDRWAEPYLAVACRGLLPDARVVGALGYNGEHGAYRLHRGACEALGFPDYRLHDGRHSWAVRHIAAGVPAEYVASQLGHASTQQTNETYGRFRPSVHTANVDGSRYAPVAYLPGGGFYLGSCG